MMRPAWSVALVLCAQISVSAQTPLSSSEIPVSKQATADAKAFRAQVVSEKEVYRNVRKLTTELKWHSRLKTATKEANKNGKPILWIQALGELNGYV